MRERKYGLTIGVALGGLLGLLIAIGCSQLSGEFNTNQPPAVEIVNVPQDAWGMDTTYHYGMPFNVPALGLPIVILSMSGASMIENSERVYSSETLVDSVAGTDTTIIQEFTKGSDYSMDYANGTLTVLAVGEMEAGASYLIDFSFLVDNYYVFSYAPMIHWVGYDADGFVDHYLYADDTTAALVNGFHDELDNEDGDPQGFLQAHLNDFAWYDTTSMEARIYLMTTEGDTTEHLFLVRAVDDQGATSQNIAFKTFYRSNNAPANPQIKRTEEPDTDYGQNRVVSDTLFSLDDLTPLWQGVSFSWKSSDPDDKELYQIPLEFTYYLVKTPGDTIWAWSDSNWTDNTQIQLYGLETGGYVFSVWVRDDGFTLCEEPASISFNALRPTFAYHILMIDETKNSGIWEVPGDSVNAFWMGVLQNLEGQLDNENYTLDGVDVRFKDNSDTGDPLISNCPISYALISQYKLVIIYSDDHANINDTYVQNRDEVLSRYLDVGGQLWVEGRRLLISWYGSVYSYQENQEVPISATTLFGKYMQMSTGYVTNFHANAGKTEFKGAIHAIEGLPELEVDSTHVALMQNYPPAENRSVLPEVDWFTRSDLATTLYTFNSSTTDSNGDVIDEDSDVQAGATPVQCTIVPDHGNLTSVSQVENITRGVLAEVESFNPDQIMVTYPYGQPWSTSDVLAVDYAYNPISDMHLKPIAIRFENQPRIAHSIVIQGIPITYYTLTLGYRTSVFTFPLYFMKNDAGQVETVVKEMLDWFFFPTIHQSSF